MNVPMIVAAAVLSLGIVFLIYLGFRQYRQGEKFKERSRNVEEDLRDANLRLENRSRPLDHRRLRRRLRRASKGK